MADSGVRNEVMTRKLPLPQPGWDNHEFWEATQRGELRFQRCSDCSAWRHYPRPVCPDCGSTRHSWELASGRGEVYTWTIVHGPTLPVFQDDLPYNVVDVLTEEGVHFVSQVLDVEPEDIRPGLPVEAVFVPASEDITLVKFRRAG